MAGVASQFITLTDEYQLLPANAINLIIVGTTDPDETLECSGTGSGDATQEVVIHEAKVITVQVLHYVKCETVGLKLYFGVS